MQGPSVARAFKTFADTRAFRVHQTEARGVPDFVGEVAIGFNLIIIPARVRTPDRSKHKARRVHAVLIEHFERVNAVALRLGHALPVLVKDRARDEDILERLSTDK